uniref:T. congolense-specific, cell surface-expressed gene family n=1 Tax=Trypanosoma congolense (strain IL3000) TaxID=1068625 RepID=G0UMR5_TRYCI|nr:hypothetical protein, unlikely [Trypanosoma congolense IL3000]
MLSLIFCFSLCSYGSNAFIITINRTCGLQGQFFFFLSLSSVARCVFVCLFLCWLIFPLDVRFICLCAGNGTVTTPFRSTACGVVWCRVGLIGEGKVGQEKRKGKGN